MDNVTLVIGAGASKDINHEISTGEELIKDIANRVTDRTSPFNRNLSKELEEQLKFPIEKLVKFLTHLDNYINSVQTPSIDEFLNEINTYPEFENDKDDFLTIGFVMILAHVFGFEGAITKKIIDEDIKTKKLTWLSTLCNYIDKNDILNKKSNIELNIITFNYDRIIEYYLLNKYEYSDEIIEFIYKRVHHVYGRAGSLDKLKPKELNDGTTEIVSQFGEYNSKLKEFKETYVNHIKIIYDKRNDTESLKPIIRDSKKILIFGYGFDSINNVRLGLLDYGDKGNPEDFKVNIYSGGYPNFNFPYRREMAKKVRSLVLDADIHYESCSEFLKNCL
jgi:hypothetical protein